MFISITEKYLRAARSLAQEAVGHLYRDPLLAGFTGGHMYEAVDGVGFLLQAMLSLEGAGPHDSKPGATPSLLPSTADRPSPADSPPRKVLIATTMGSVTGELDERLVQTEALIDAAARQAALEHPGRRLDLLALPEHVLTSGNPTSAHTRAIPLDGPARELFSRKARQYETYLIGTLILREEQSIGNAAVVFDRNGEVAGIYRKVHPVAAQDDNLEGGITPGDEYTVIECDFGKIGILICWDMVYEEAWDKLSELGAEIVVVSSASPQTLRPMAQALRHRYFVVTSTPRNNASIFNPVGLTIARTTNAPALVCEVDLAYAVLHWSARLKDGRLLTHTYGDRVGYRYSRREDTGVFWSNDPETPIGRMIADLGLEQMPDQIERYRALRDQVSDV